MNNENENINERPEADSQLDAALEKWGRATVSDLEAVEIAKQRTLDAWQLEREPKVKLSAAKRMEGKPKLSRMRLAALTLAAFVVGFVVTQLLRSASNDVARLQTIERETISAASIDEIQQNKKLAHFAALFGDQLGAVAEFDDEIQIDLNELGEIQHPILESSNFLAIKLVLLSRPAESNQDSWKVEHRIHVLARPQRRVDIESKTAMCSLWAMPVDEGLISIDLNFNLRGDRNIEFASNALQHSLDSKQIHSMIQAGTEYRLYQTGTRLGQVELDSAAIRAGDSVSRKALAAGVGVGLVKGRSPADIALPLRRFVQ